MTKQRHATLDAFATSMYLHHNKWMQGIRNSVELAQQPNLKYSTAST